MEQERLKHYLDLFEPKQQQLRKCYNAFLLELQRGLSMHERDPSGFHPEESSLMMLDCCVDALPTLREKGTYYALDFGGTNVRAIRCVLDGQGHANIHAESHNIRNVHVSSMLKKGLLDAKATASQLFDELAFLVGKLATEKTAKGKEQGLGFTFSFPVSQKSVNSARLMGWTKDFETGIDTNDPVVAQDVCALLNNALARKQVSARTTVVLNDTVGCMLAGSYAKPPNTPPCYVGVILGTGVNGAYVQRDAKLYGYKGIVINTELGNFNKELPRNIIDYQIDYQSPIRGRQQFEKMVSGMYIPEIARLLILHVVQERAPDELWTPFCLSGEGVGSAFSYPHTLQSVLEKEMNWKIEDPSDLDLISRLIDAAYRRSAAISAVAIAGMCKATGCLQPAMGGLTVGVDGTLYLKNPKFQTYVEDYLKLVLDEETAKLVHLVIAEDGSGRGAAILAAAISS